MPFGWISALFRRLLRTVDQRTDRIRRAIQDMTQWAAFEPNTPETWRRVVAEVSDYLTGVWRKGELVGRVAQDAFFVRCDHSTMTQDDIDNGRLVCVVGIAPVRPAEFVIMRIGQWTADAKP
jgi:phage tail sheath protein FI